MTKVRVSAYMAAEGVSLRDAFCSTTFRGDLEWDDSDVTEGKVSAGYVAAEGVSLRNTFFSMIYSGGLE